MDRKRQRSLSMSGDAQALLRRQAAKSGKTVSGYVLDLALADDTVNWPVVLSQSEQREIHEALTEILDKVRGVARGEVAGEGLSHLEVMAALKAIAVLEGEAGG